MAFIHNSLEWSLKCNSDGNAIAGHCGDALRALHAFVPHGGGGGGRGECVTSARRVFAITLPRERLSEILNETPKPAVSGLCFDTICKPFKKILIIDKFAGNPERDLYEQNYWFFRLEDRERDPSETSVSLRKYNH